MGSTFQRSGLAGLASCAALVVVVCCGWFAVMELVLRHPGFAWRCAAAAAIAAEGALTVALFQDLVTAPALRWPLTIGAAVTGLLGAWILVDDVSRPELPSSAHFEGYLLIIGLALVVYGLSTIAAMLLVAPASRRHHL